MKQHPNFYENINEANIRIRHTIVLYDNEPFYVMAVADHKPDGIFRVYLDPLGRDPNSPETAQIQKVHSAIGGLPQGHPAVGPELDKQLDAYPNCGVLRKMMNSPAFNKFRPYPLGMCHIRDSVYYIERQPLRPATQQGLTKNMTVVNRVTASTIPALPGSAFNPLDIYSKEFKNCILGRYPTPERCLEGLLDFKHSNEAAAFDREFALVRGPLEMLFLGYKTDVIGVLPKNNFDSLRLGNKFTHCREVVENLRLFKNII